MSDRVPYIGALDPAELARLAGAVTAGSRWDIPGRNTEYDWATLRVRGDRGRDHVASYPIAAAEFMAYVGTHRDAIVAAVDLAHDERWLIDRQTQLLTDAVNVMRGDPPPLTLWSHHDVADLARALIADRDERRQELIAAANVLSPSESVQVGGRGVAAAAKIMRTERDEAVAAVGRVEAWARELAARPTTTAVDVAAAEVGHEALRRLRGEV